MAKGNGHGNSNGHANGHASPAPGRDALLSAKRKARGQRCAHCRRRRLWLRRGLCWPCYADPLILGKHFTPACTRSARSFDMREALDLLAGVDVPADQAAPCPGPLPGWVGSPERLAALAQRVEAKQGLFPARGR